MKIVIVGAGATGTLLADHLIRRGNHEVTLVEADEHKAERLSGELDALVLHGDGTRPDILKKARVQDADALVATTGSDAVNTVVVLLARRYEVGTVAVRLKSDDLRAACHEAGVDHVVTPKVSAVTEIAAAITGGAGIDLSILSQAGVMLLRLPVHRDLEVGDLGLPEGTLLVGVVRSDEDAALPRAGMELERGDELLVLVEGEGRAEEVRERLGATE